MIRLIAAIVFCMLPFTAAAKEAEPLAEDPVVEQRLNRLAEELRCLVCQNESLAGSLAELANDLRREVHYAMALEKIAQKNVPDRIHAEEALAVYSPRAVYILFTLLNKLQGLNLPAARKDHLRLVLLAACDQANTLWSHPTARERPRQRATPPRYRENNIWLALEKASDLGVTRLTKTPLTLWPEVPPSTGGICLYQGRLRELAKAWRSRTDFTLDIQAVAAALPRPNQAYWTLSALWAGWLWGREVISPFKSV